MSVLKTEELVAGQVLRRDESKKACRCFPDIFLSFYIYQYYYSYALLHFHHHHTAVKAFGCLFYMTPENSTLPNIGQFFSRFFDNK